VPLRRLVTGPWGAAAQFRERGRALGKGGEKGGRGSDAVPG